MLQLTKFNANADYICLAESAVQKLIWDSFASSGDNNSEAVEQKKIIHDLEAIGFQVVKIVVGNKAGVADIIAWSPVGQIWLIEVKKEKGSVLAPLQEAKLKLAWENNAVVMVAYGCKDFRAKFKAIKEAGER